MVGLGAGLVSRRGGGGGGGVALDGGGGVAGSLGLGSGLRSLGPLLLAELGRQAGLEGDGAGGEAGGPAAGAGVAVVAAGTRVSRRRVGAAPVETR